MRGLVALCLVAVASFAGCSGGSESVPEAAGRVVWGSIEPQRFVLSRLLHETADVRILLPPGQPPATYDPTPRRLAELSGADALALAGVPFESGLAPRLADLAPGLRVLRSYESVSRIPMSHTCTHVGEDGEHAHAASERVDPHFWLDPLRLAEYATTLAVELGELYPEASARIDARLAELRDELVALDERIRDRLAPHAGRALLVFHPAFGYFAERYGLEQIAVESAGNVPTPRHLAELEERVRRERIALILVQVEFSDRAAETWAAEAGIRVERVDPLSSDYLANLESLAEVVASALGGPGEEESAA